MIFGVESSLGSSSDNDELINSLSVLEVLIKIVLEMLDLIHVLLNKVISSNSLEFESLVVKLPSVNSGWSGFWVLSLFLELSVEVHGIVVVMLIEAS